jgi:hypothetical protein
MPKTLPAGNYLDMNESATFIFPKLDFQSQAAAFIATAI